MILSLPKPTGSYQIGVKMLHFVNDTALPSFEHLFPRDIPLMIWYPVDFDTSIPTAPYITDDLIKTIRKIMIYKLLFPKKLTQIQTNGYRDAPISYHQETYPVILFNHGYSTYIQSNSHQMENLASHGYIVVAIGHPDDGALIYPNLTTSAVFLPDFKDSMKSSKHMDKLLKIHLPEIQKSSLDQIDRKILTEKIITAGGKLNEKMPLWLQDIAFITTKLKELDANIIESPFGARMDLSHGIGIFGHSLGGAASIMACHEQKDLVCAINEDGGMFGAFRKSYRYHKPVMYIESELNIGLNRYFYEIAENDAFLLRIHGAEHMDLTDYTFTKNRLSKLMQLTGKINASRISTILNEYLLAFFDKYLKKQEPALFHSCPFGECNFHSKYG